MEQIKIMEIFNKRGLNKLNKIFGPDNIVYLPKSSLAGIKYDYDNNKLQYVMEKIPFSVTQQFIITPNKFADIILNLCKKGYNPNCKFYHTSIDENDLENFRIKLKKIRTEPNQNTKKALLEVLLYLENEYDTFIESITFYSNNERYNIQANGILFSESTSLEITDEIFMTH
ncbi:TPA: hypothetical protein ACGSMF_003511 [Bacillus cereus]